MPAFRPSVGTWSARWGPRLIVAAGATLGIVYFAHYYGLWRVDPRTYAWVMSGPDRRWHHTAWQFFRREPWGWPPGRMDRLLYPVGTSIANTDSLPLLAIALKPWSAYLSADFQYFGPWLLLCAALHGAWAGMLMRLTGGVWPFQLLGVGLFVLNPNAMLQVDHVARCASGWVTLAGLWLYFRPRGSVSPRRELCAWSVLCVLAAGINAYVCLMALSLAAAGFLRRWWPDRTATAARSALGLASVVSMVLLLLYLQGYFILGRYEDLTVGVLGHWSMNLLAPINPLYWSTFLPDLPTATPGQYEGFAYFGLGILALAAAGAIALLARPPEWAVLAEVTPVVVTTGVLVIVAIGPTVTFGPYVLFELPYLLYAPFAPFRASGRLFLPAFYLMLFLLLRMLARRLPWWGASAALLAVLAVQYVDLIGPMEQHIRPTAIDEEHVAWEQPLHWDAWRFATDRSRRLLLVPPDAWHGDSALAFAYLAARCGLAVNAGEPARVDITALQAANSELGRQLAAGELDREAVYVVREDYLHEFRARVGDRVACARIDGFNACMSRQ